MRATRTQPDAGRGPLQRPLRELCCVNPKCPDKGKRGCGNLSVRTGKGGGEWRILRCSTCRVEFSERRGTALFNARVTQERIVSVAEHLKEGCGIRGTSRLTGASKDGVTSVAIRLGLHARALHDEHVRGVDVNEVQFDEKWSFVGKKQKHCDPSDPADAEMGDQWDHTAIDAESRMVVSAVVSKRDGAATKEVVADFADRTGGSAPPP